MSFYGNIINTPSSFQKIGVGNSGVLAAENLGNTVHFVGDNKLIRPFINNDEIKIEHINSSKIKHNYQVQPANQIITGENQPITLSQITSLNIDEVGHTNLLIMQNYNLELVGKKYRDAGNVLRGEIFNDYNDNVASGAYSHAEGLDTEATGYVAHSEGWKTKASGGQGHAEGRSTQALSNTDHAEGFETIAHGAYRTTDKEGYGAHAEGRNTQAIGQSSHAEGYSSIADGFVSHAEGINTTTVNSILCTAEIKSYDKDNKRIELIIHSSSNNLNLDQLCQFYYEHVYYQVKISEINIDNVVLSLYGNSGPSILHPGTTIELHTSGGAFGEGSHVEGAATIAKGNYSHAEGIRTQAIGHYSHAGGYETKAEGVGSFTHGKNTIANNNYSASFGKFNKIDENAIFQVGIGEEGACKNALNIKDNGLVQIPSSNLEAKDIIATDTNTTLSKMPINIEDTDYYFTITQGDYNKTIAKTYNAIVKEAKIGDDEEEGKKLILTFYGPNHKDITLSVDLSDVYLDAHVIDSNTIDLWVNDNGEIIGEIITNSIKENHLSDYIISTNKIRKEAVVTDKIAQDAIITDKILNGAVTDSKIKSLSFEKVTGNVPTARLDGEIETKQIKSGAVTSAKIANEFYTNYIDTKMNVIDPTGTGSISINRKTDSIIGQKSSTFGNNNIASGNNSFAEGSENEAKGLQSHVEGTHCSTGANAPNSHAEGLRTQANNSQSHAEGNGTIASKPNQHVQGRWNIEDTSNPGFAHIVGNGTSDTNRSNAHTLDWKGNAWYAGQVTATGTEVDYIILRSSSENSDKKFKLTINDEAVLSLEEV